MRGGEQGLVEATLLREPGGEHVGGVRERFDAVEHARGRVGHDGEPDPLGIGGQRLGEEQPPLAGRQHDPEQTAEGVAAARLEQLGDLPLQLVPRNLAREPQVAVRALEPIEVVGERERPACVDADHLEHAVAADETLVGRRNHRLRGRPDAPVEAGQIGGPYLGCHGPDLI